jgi:hypothetical protein
VDRGRNRPSRSYCRHLGAAFHRDSFSKTASWLLLVVPPPRGSFEAIQPFTHPPPLAKMDYQSLPTESSPLLEHVERHKADTSSRPDGVSNKNWERIRTSLRKHWAIWSHMYVCGLFVLLIDIPNYMAQAPKLRVLELGLCRDYYALIDPGMIHDDGTVDEGLCKVTQIQSSLARMRGYLGMLEMIPGLLLAVPYGILADINGRRLVIGLCLLGCVLRDCWIFVALYFYRTFVTSTVYAAPAFLLLGGGPTLFGPMVLSMMAAATSEDLR